MDGVLPRPPGAATAPPAPPAEDVPIGPWAGVDPRVADPHRDEDWPAPGPPIPAPYEDRPPPPEVFAPPPVAAPPPNPNPQVFEKPRFMCNALDDAEAEMRKLWAWRERQKAGPPPDPVADDERAVAAPEVRAACASSFDGRDSIDITLAWDLLRRRVANGDKACAALLTSQDLSAAIRDLDAVLDAEADGEAMRACADAVTGAWALCARAGGTQIVDDAAACASGLLTLLERPLTVRAYVNCAGALQSLCRASDHACRRVLTGEGVKVLATALVWCVLDEDHSTGGLLKVVDTDLGCALVDLLALLAAVDATKIIGPLDDETTVLVGVALRAILLDERPQWTVPPLCKSGFHLLLRAPPSYYEWLVENGSVPRLLTLLEPLVVLYLVERDPDAQEPDAQIAPCLECVLNSARCGARGLEATKAWIYPPADDARWRADLAANAARAQTDADFADAVAESRRAPVDAPPYAMRTLLVELIYKCPSKKTRRLAGDLALSLCGGDEAEFALRVGGDAACVYLEGGPTGSYAPGGLGSEHRNPIGP